MARANRATSTVDATEDSTEDIATTSQSAQQVAVPEPSYDDDTLRGITSFQDAINAAGYMFGQVDDASEVLGNGFRLLKETDSKTRLVGVPMMLLQWDFHQSEEFGGEFVSITLVTNNEDGSIGKYIANDGSTGVCKTLREYTQRTGRRGGLAVRNGFRESQYMFCQDCRTAVGPDHATVEPGHKVGRARTYYLDTSA